MDSTHHSVHRRVCTASTTISNTLFQYPLPRDGDKTQLIGIEITTVQPPPSLDTLLRDLGALTITANEHTIVTLPVALLGALGTVHYVGTELHIAFDFRPFVRFFPMSAFQWSTPFVGIRVGSRRYVQAVRFVFYCKRYTENGYTSGNFRSHIQQVLTQARCSPAPTTQFVFPLNLSQPTKGFFLDGTPNSVHLVDASGERLLSSSETLGDYVFVPIASHADIYIADVDSYVGSYCNTQETAYLKVVFAEPRSYAAVHCLYQSMLRIREGVVQPVASATNGVLTPSPRWWLAVIKTLDPDRAECPITYEHIGPIYYQCDGCQYAFDSTAFCNYASTLDSLICPMCRRPWTACIQYRHPQM